MGDHRFRVNGVDKTQSSSHLGDAVSESPGFGKPVDDGGCHYRGADTCQPDRGDEAEDQIKMPKFLCQAAGCSGDSKDDSTEDDRLFRFPMVAQSSAERRDDPIEEEMDREHHCSASPAPAEFFKDGGEKTENECRTPYPSVIAMVQIPTTVQP